MAYTKNKNIIEYKGRLYNISYNISNGKLTTNHPKGKEFIEQTVYRSECDLARFLRLVIYINGVIDPYIETIMTCAPYLWHAIIYSSVGQTEVINQLINIAKKNWKIVLDLEEKNKNPYISNLYLHSINQITELIYTLSLNLNELELKWFKYYPSAPFIKKFAGQLEMYGNLLSSQTSSVVEWYARNNIDITPYLKNKNLLQVLKDLEVDMDKLKNEYIGKRITRVYEKYKHIEGTDVNGWTYKLLSSREEFEQEAEKMRNCLMRCRYDEKMSAEKSLIVAATTPEGQRIDLEIILGTNPYLNQAYYRDDVHVSSYHMEYLKEWVKNLSF